MLGDAAGFAGRHFGRADGVKERGLAVVDVAHDGDHGRTRLQVRRIVGRVEHAFFDVRLGDAPHGVAELLGNELGGIGVDRIGDLRHVTLLHEDADHVDRALGHAVGQLLNSDRLRDRHFARNLFLRLVAVTGHALVAATERGDRAFADLVGGERRHDGEPAAALLGADARRLRRRCRARGDAAAPRAARSFLFVGFKRGSGRGRRLERRRGLCAEPLLGDFVGLALGLFVVLAPFFFVALARFGLCTVGFLELFTRLPNPRFLFGDLALFRFAQTRVGERVCARAALFLGERAQYDAGRLRRGGRRRSRCRRARRAPGRGNVALRRRRGTALDRRRRLRLRLARTDAALHLFDNDRFAAAMAEALAHDALFDAAALERQRLGRGDAQLLAAIFVRLSHTRSYLRPVLPRRSLSGLMLLIAGAKPLQAPATRQKGFARRSGEQGSMYHIWAAQCQIQLRRGQKSNLRRRYPRPVALGSGLKLAYPVGGRSRGMKDGNNLFMFQGGFRFGEAGRDRPGLSGHRQSIENRSFQEPFRLFGEVRGEPDLPLEPAAKDLALDRLAQRLPAGRYP